jgi:2-phosphosulfolactate phosphatase
LYHFGASRVILETDPEKAREMKQRHPEYILVGEVNEVPMEGADLGNSPSEIIKKGRDFFAGKTIIHRTTAGVTGAVAAFQKADEVVLGSYVTAAAVARYIQEKAPRTVTFVGMGDRANRPAPEDEACADYMEHLVTGKPYDPIGALQRIVFQVTAQKFLVGGKEYLPREDPIFCLQRDLFDFVLVVRKEGERLESFRVSTGPPEAKEAVTEGTPASPENAEEQEPKEPVDEDSTEAGAGSPDSGDQKTEEPAHTEGTEEQPEMSREEAGPADEDTEEVKGSHPEPSFKKDKKKKNTQKKRKKKSSA